jgi:hypothetical protein
MVTRDKMAGKAKQGASYTVNFGSKQGRFQKVLILISYVNIMLTIRDITLKTMAVILTNIQG